ncbi:uncharacterized protein KY384_000364 [Bacidia gigantensis]|uniref:uncharacterized protein n=1 Tax=Bacidia gigantensis TaxID=2732470 RepID=UPI001D037622|nr:uncharacterized protein KY384_000364 [Bacidia gigantensis]KAG8526371.1 hypothetical protein KY384_000364 [Bacidia gigantensis]
MAPTQGSKLKSKDSGRKLESTTIPHRRQSNKVLKSWTAKMKMYYSRKPPGNGNDIFPSPQESVLNVLVVDRKFIKEQCKRFLESLAERSKAGASISGVKELTAYLNEGRKTGAFYKSHHLPRGASKILSQMWKDEDVTFHIAEDAHEEECRTNPAYEYWSRGEDRLRKQATRIYQMELEHAQALDQLRKSAEDVLCEQEARVLALEKEVGVLTGKLARRDEELRIVRRKQTKHSSDEEQDEE